VGILAQLADVVNGIACRSTRTETFRTDIDGIGTMVNGRNTAFQVLCGGKQFKWTHEVTQSY
jgi:hypothetical protein